MPNKTQIHNTFGVEFEFRDSPLNKIYHNLKSKKLSHPIKKCYNRYVKSDGSCWHVKYDGSTTTIMYDGDNCGGEIATPALHQNKNAFLEMYTILDVLNDSAPAFDNKTGLHIHINLGLNDQFKVILTWMLFEKEIFKLFPERKTSQYAENPYRVVAKNLDKRVIQKVSLIAKQSFLYNNHHDILFFYPRTVNGQKYNFVEIRLGQMSENKYFIIGWVKICLQLIKYAIKINNIYTFLDEEPERKLKWLNSMERKNSAIKLNKYECDAIFSIIDRT